MTEADWLASTDPEKMLEFLKGKMSNRKKFFLFLTGLSYGRAEAHRAYCNLLRCIFGYPFRPVTIDPASLRWHEGLLLSMARQMYDSRDFTDMPILADALEDAGCTDQDILNHCRQPGEHVRGCWVVDLLIDKQ